MLNFRMNMPISLMVFYGSIMIIVVWLLRVGLKNRLPKFVFPVLWSLVMLRLVVPFSISSPLSLPEPSAFLQGLQIAVGEPLFQETALIEDVAIISGKTMNGERVNAISRSEESTYMIAQSQAPAHDFMSESVSWLYGLFSSRRFVFTLYLLGLAGTVGILGWQKYCYSRKLKTGLLMEHNETVNEMLRSMDMGDILVFTNDEIASPLVCGLLCPRIYLPTKMDFQNTVLLRHILSHEVMHIRRRDNWRKAVMLFVLCLNWYNPLVWLMAKCLASDLEAACDEAVLRKCDEEEQKGYALSLLAMAVSGSRTALLYSAFSRTEVERRIKSIVHYKKASAAMLMCAVLFLLCNVVVFASGAQAPFTKRLTSYCASDASKWGVSARITRDIMLGKNYEERAERVIFTVLREDETEDPDVIEEAILEGLAREFGVERRAFELQIGLCLSREEVDAEYKAFGLVRGEDGCFMYQGETVRVYEDKMLGSYQSREDGTADVSVERDRMGKVTGITVWRQGDKVFDQRTGDRLQYRYYDNGLSYGTAEVIEER